MFYVEFIPLIAHIQSEISLIFCFKRLIVKYNTYGKDRLLDFLSGTFHYTPIRTYAAKPLGRGNRKGLVVFLLNLIIAG